MELSKQFFDEILNTKFWLEHGGPERESMDLIEVREGKSTPRNEQFSLTFRGDRAKVLPQRLYPMEHASVGAFELFLVPIGQDESGTFYEAVFNRLHKDNQGNH